VGPITSHWINAPTKQAILLVIATAQTAGVSARCSCAILAISHRRVVRWQTHVRQGLGLADATPGPREALHRLRPEETACILAMAKSQEYVDLSHRILAVTAGEQGLFFASFSTVYRILKAGHLMTARGPGGAHNGHSLAPVRKVLTGPNQRWCWDISYLLTFEKGVYLYLYLLLDEFSRKVLQWRISWTQTAAEARLLLEGGLGQENILDLPEDQRPELLNDRGRQMKAKPIRQLCADHQMPHLFARPHTPNDNPFVESAFSTVKRAPEYPGRFLDDVQAVTYCAGYFDWYNHEHYHSAIDYVTPQQAHEGQRGKIVQRRLRQHRAQRLRRRAENQQQQITNEKARKPNPSAACLVA
jgi:transposase InsO family protein